MIFFSKEEKKRSRSCCSPRQGADSGLLTQSAVDGKAQGSCQLAGPLRRTNNHSKPRADSWFYRDTITAVPVPTVTHSPGTAHHQQRNGTSLPKRGVKLGELGLSCRRTALGGLRDAPHQCPSPAQSPARTGTTRSCSRGLFPRAEPQRADAEKRMSLSTATGATATGTAGDPSSALPPLFVPSPPRGRNTSPAGLWAG